MSNFKVLISKFLAVECLKINSHLGEKSMNVCTLKIL